jgi:hypothetical protein
MSELKNNDPQLDPQALMEIMGGMYIQLLRIYDMLSLIVPDQSKASELISLHESGRVLSPDPALILDDE